MLYFSFYYTARHLQRAGACFFNKNNNAAKMINLIILINKSQKRLINLNQLAFVELIY